MSSSLDLLASHADWEAADFHDWASSFEQKSLVTVCHAVFD